jgi:NitT/TauT family transport system substrate-binding protein
MRLRRLATLVALVAFAATVLPAAAQDKRVIRVGEGPFITGGAFYIARDKGYFDKLGVTVDAKMFIDGALAVPSLISGELDISFMTASANLFNSIAKGAPIVLFLDRGYNKVGRGYTALSVNQQLYAQGIHSWKDLGKLKGRQLTVGTGALGSINQYEAARAFIAAGIDPRKDVKWIVNIPQPDIAKMMGQNQVDFADLAYQFGFFAQRDKWGTIIGRGDEIEPNSGVGMYAVRKDFLANNRETLIRFIEAYLQGAKEFNAAAADPSAHPDIVAILAKDTSLSDVAVVKAIAPAWSAISEDGMPQIASVMKQQDFWANYYTYVEKEVPADQLFDTSLLKEAKARLDHDHPFAGMATPH